MNPLNELRGMVASSAKVSVGTVTAVGSSTLTVRSRTGLKSFSISGDSVFKPGDTVRFQGNVLLGKTSGAENVPVFNV